MYKLVGGRGKNPQIPGGQAAGLVTLDLERRMFKSLSIDCF